MKAIASLVREHEVMSSVVAALEAYVQRLEHREPVDPEDLARFAEIFEALGDCIHHEKEENILLPLLSRNGFEWSRGLLARVRSEHRQERYLTNVLFQSSQRAGSWNDEHRRYIAANGRALVEFQRRHHDLENRRLFPEMDFRLSDSAKAELAALLEAFDANAVHCARSNRALALASELSRTYAPDRRGQRCYESSTEFARP
jgi:hemerythrin-like domain-containing protein